MTPHPRMGRRVSPWAALAVGLLTLLFAPDCTQAPLAGATSGSGGAGGFGGAAGAGGAGGNAGGGASADEGVLLWGSVWTLGWDRAGVIPARGGGFDVTTDHGYRVSVSSGWIVDHSVSFGPCVVPPADGSSRWLPFHLGIRSAFAHDDADLSSIEIGLGEDLAIAGDAGPYQSIFPAQRYCRAHWLLGRATGMLDAPASADLAGKSVRIDGRYSRGDEHGTLAVDTWWPHGHIDDLTTIIDPAELEIARHDPDPWVARVTVTRALGRVFDGIELGAATADEIAGRVVDNLAEHATIRVSLFKPPSL